MVGMMSGWLQERGQLNFGFLLIFIGLGLLRGSNLQRTLSGGLLALGLVGAVIVLVISIVSRPVSENPPSGLQIPVMIGFLLISSYCFFVLRAARSDEWFAEKYGGKAPAYVIPVTVVLTLLASIGHELNNHQRREGFARIFHYDVGIRIIDANTGELVENVAITQSHENLTDGALPKAMQEGPLYCIPTGDQGFRSQGMPKLLFR